MLTVKELVPALMVKMLVLQLPLQRNLLHGSSIDTPYLLQVRVFVTGLDFCVDWSFHL